MDLTDVGNKRKRVNRAQIAYEAIKNSILNQVIKPGDCLSETSIAEKLNMSRTPVREALKMLANEDLIEIRNGVGAYVKTLSFKDILDIFEVRKNLETLAVETSINNITIQELERLEEQLKELQEEYCKGEAIDFENFNKIDIEIHRLFISKCDNKYVKSIMEEIQLRIAAYQFISLSELGNMEESINQHLKLIELAKSGDVDELKKELARHIEWSLNSIIKRKNI
ncbi:DNA-binding transcriptional regulator, GntR family [Dethiosulfatibacter aminovorans DSM 17477]|uniref:DNA-binding transcriptional regulator, GntR family n=1 Tax=Dethiosulfatibacter aminovorans DSM 17477 TaxID=1121476 RepID=A0A1M6F092_9FIRM|nr:GntR family transcriptional regulator [Dethiosulfatibacter aminovorans]SHI91071.1 DNA-binding transcriptional regulator, GntR family [Dethiosulfatibacter aminovorans DSM 17477]